MQKTLVPEKLFKFDVEPPRLGKEKKISVIMLKPNGYDLAKHHGLICIWTQSFIAPKQRNQHVKIVVNLGIY